MNKRCFLLLLWAAVSDQEHRILWSQALSADGLLYWSSSIEFWSQGAAARRVASGCFKGKEGGSSRKLEGHWRDLMIWRRMQLSDWSNWPSFVPTSFVFRFVRKTCSSKQLAKVGELCEEGKAVSWPPSRLGWDQAQLHNKHVDSLVIASTWMSSLLENGWRWSVLMLDLWKVHWIFQSFVKQL